MCPDESEFVTYEFISIVMFGYVWSIGASRLLQCYLSFLCGILSNVLTDTWTEHEMASCEQLSKQQLLYFELKRGKNN